MTLRIHKYIYIVGFLFWLIGCCSMEIRGARFQNETLHYVISYKWGLIHKDAGEATLTLSNKDTKFEVMLSARTKPWADKFYSVRDTLTATLLKDGLKPISYKKTTHEKKEHKIDEITYSYTGSTVNGIAKRYRWDKGKKTVTEKTLTSSGPTYDMLSIFYYLRSLNFENLKPSQTVTATVFSGKRKETIKIRNMGVEMVKLRDKTERKAYHIKFSCTKEGGKKSGEDMDTWISTDSSHIPLYLVGKLPVGEIRAYYTGK